jgi:hypothetical protein
MSADDVAPAGDQSELIRVDARGRINIGKHAAAGTNYLMSRGDDGVITLQPAVVMTITEFEAFARGERASAAAAPATPCGAVCQASHPDKPHPEDAPAGEPAPSVA